MDAEPRHRGSDADDTRHTDDQTARHTDDETARHAAQSPLETATSPDPTPPSRKLSWTGPVLAVGIAVVVLLAWVLL